MKHITTYDRLMGVHILLTFSLIFESILYYSFPCFFHLLLCFAVYFYFCLRARFPVFVVSFISFVLAYFVYSFASLLCGHFCGWVSSAHQNPLQHYNNNNNYINIHICRAFMQPPAPLSTRQYGAYIHTYVLTSAYGGANVNKTN